MNEGRFKVGTLARLSGFGVPTLRNWERRYGLLQPTRVSSGHRLYTDADLSTLQRIKSLLEEGQSIGEIAALGRALLLATPAPMPSDAQLAKPDDEAQAGLSTLSDALPYFVLDALPCGVLVTDSLGRTQWLNKRFERICGYGLAELGGRTPGSVLQGAETDQEAVRRIAQAVARAQPCSTRILNYDAKQRAYWAELDIAPLQVGADTRGFVATVREVSAEVEALPPVER